MTQKLNPASRRSRQRRVSAVTEAMADKLAR
jgi:hypothetical protein